MSENVSQSELTVNNQVKNKTFKSKKSISDDLMEKLYDETLIKRFGTALKENMGKDYKEFLEKKFLILEKEFARINKNSDDIIDYEELRDFVNSYQSETGRVLPENYCKQLFDLIDLNHDKTITIQEFIFSYMLLEEKLKLKKLKLTKLVDELEDVKEKLEVRYKENENEEINKYGVSTIANLDITLLEARELKPMDFNGKSDPYCVMTLNDKQRVISSYKPNTLNPVWNEKYNL